MIDSSNKSQIIIKLKHYILKAAASAGEGHIPSAFSVLDILWVLYDKILALESIKKGAIDRDRFILSKGHASLALYAVLAEKGFFPISELEKFCQFDSLLGGHPDSNKVPGVEASTGSLGHGLPIAVGIALGYKIQSIPNRVFALVGDGECNEGSIWEAALLATHHKLYNLCCIIDYNHSTDRALLLNDLNAKFRAFEWECITINGHNHNEIFNALTKQHREKPVAIIAETIKGHGSSTMKNEPAWHHRAPTKDEYAKIIKEISET
jgi:transketolase